MSWMLCLPVFLTAPWVFWQANRLSAITFRAHVDEAYAKMRLRRMGVAIGFFELSVAGTLVALNTTQGRAMDSLSTVPTLTMLGLGFIVWGSGYFQRRFPLS